MEMNALIMGVLGIPAGLALDALTVRLAVPFAGEDEEEEAQPSRPRTLLQDETGSLVVAAPPGQTWVRRALIVAATAGLFAAAGARYDDVSQLPIIAAYVAVLVLCASTDILAFRVPNVVTYPALLFALLVGALMPDADIVEVAAGGLLAGGILLVPSLFTGGSGMGMGDVKLAAFAGLALGFVHVVPALLFMAFAGGIVAALLLVLRLRKRGEPIPYAPFISAGAVAALLWQGAAFAQLA